MIIMNSKELKYESIFNDMKKRITSSEYQNGDRLPSENSLCNHYCASRITIRTALQLLIDEGYIKKGRGRQSIITKDESATIFANLNEFTTDLRHADKPLYSNVLMSKMIEPTEKIRMLLNLKVDEKVYCIKRIRLLQDTKMVYQESYLSSWLPIDFRKLIMTTTTSLKQVFSDNNIVMKYCDEIIEVKYPEHDIKEMLELDDRTAIIYRERVTFDDQNRPFEFVLNYYNANQFKYYIKKGKP